MHTAHHEEADPGTGVVPHGGRLVDRALPPAEAAELLRAAYRQGAA